MCDPQSGFPISTQPGKRLVGKSLIGGQPGTRGFGFWITDLRIVPPPPPDREGTNYLRSFLNTLEGNLKANARSGKNKAEKLDSGFCYQLSPMDSLRRNFFCVCSLSFDTNQRYLFFLAPRTLDSGLSQVKKKIAPWTLDSRPGLSLRVWMAMGSLCLPLRTPDSGLRTRPQESPLA